MWFLNDLFVDPNARRSGTGRQLMKAAAEFALNSGAARLELATAKDNLPAKTLYESEGYRMDEQFDHYELPIG